MKRTNDYEKKPSQLQSFTNPTTLNLQTRPFSPIQSDDETQVTEVQAKHNSSGDLLKKLISRPTPEMTAPIQRKSFTVLPCQRKPIQAKLNIGEPNDKYEQEADATAAQVVKQINSSSQEQSVQRKGVIEEEELQMKSLVQRRENLGGGEASPDLESSIQSARGGGQSLDASLQTKMGQAMGADFSSVKVHTDSQSDQLNQSIQAKAFTTGQDVFFRQGAYDPSSQGGQELIAHELTHVVQQNGNTVQTKLESPTIQRVSVKERIKFFESLGDGDSMKSTEFLPDNALKEENGGTNYQNYTVLPEYGAQEEEQEQGFFSTSKSETIHGAQEQNSGEYTVLDNAAQEQNSGEYTVLDNGAQEQSSGKYTVLDNGLQEEDSRGYMVLGNGLQEQDSGGYTVLGGLEDENDNYEAPKKYTKEMHDEYRGEDKDSSKFVFEKVFATTKEQFMALPDQTKTTRLKSIGWTEQEIAEFLLTAKSKVKYLETEESRADYELIGGSNLMQGVIPMPFETKDMFANGVGKGHAIFVMSPDNKIYSSAHRIGQFHHSSFLGGLPTAAAGTLEVNGGNLKTITAKTGHYASADINERKLGLMQVLVVLKGRGVNLSGVKIKDYNLVELAPNAQVFLEGMGG